MRAKYPSHGGLSLNRQEAYVGDTPGRNVNGPFVELSKGVNLESFRNRKLISPNRYKVFDLRMYLFICDNA